MKNNISPWLHQLKITRSVDTLGSDVKTDIAIVGAGIAGVMTAYFTLKYTDKQVLLIEANRVAHGATGHNAGQIVFEFEEGFTTLVERYGLEMAGDAERLVRGAWLLLEEIYQDANLTTPMSSFMGYNGYSTMEQVLIELKHNALRQEADLQVFPVYISETAKGVEDIPKEYKSLYNLVPHEDVLSLLESKDKQYIAVISERKGCVNSAMLIEEIVGYMLSMHKGRFMLVEESPMQSVLLEKESAVLTIGEYKVTTDRIVLCTNGFEKFKIVNAYGTDIDVKFHHMVKGNVGYMAAYLEEMKHPPIALQFSMSDEGVTAKSALEKDPYFYFTRRPYETEKEGRHNLICTGGPEQHIDDTVSYIPDSEFMIEASDTIEGFLHKTYKGAPNESIDFKFKWHGLMGYTPTGMRVVGAEPKNPVLMYNLGCNGIGILTSIYGGKRIGDILSGRKLNPSVFDPRVEY